MGRMEAVLRQAPRAPDEARLAERFRRGEQAAFEEIVSCHRRTVYSVARRLLRSHEDADEAAQVAFVKAWNARSRFRGAARLKTWLVSISGTVTGTYCPSPEERMCWRFIGVC